MVLSLHRLSLFFILHLSALYFRQLFVRIDALVKAASCNTGFVTRPLEGQQQSFALL